LWEGTGNKESISRMFSKDSILLWLMKTHKRNRKKYGKKLSDPLNAHITFYRLRSRKDIAFFQAALSNA
jgi:hypothetical protein